MMGTTLTGFFKKGNLNYIFVIIVVIYILYMLFNYYGIFFLSCFGGDTNVSNSYFGKGLINYITLTLTK